MEPDEEETEWWDPNSRPRESIENLEQEIDELYTQQVQNIALTALRQYPGEDLQENTVETIEGFQELGIKMPSEEDIEIYEKKELDEIPTPDKFIHLSIAYSAEYPGDFRPSRLLQDLKNHPTEYELGEPDRITSRKPSDHQTVEAKARRKGEDNQIVSDYHPVLLDDTEDPRQN